MEKEGNWGVFSEGEWRIVVPIIDSKPHSTQKRGKKLSLAWFSCPCKPKVDFQSNIIIHNSFSEREAVDTALAIISSSM